MGPLTSEPATDSDMLMRVYIHYLSITTFPVLLLPKRHFSSCLQILRISQSATASKPIGCYQIIFCWVTLEPGVHVDDR